MTTAKKAPVKKSTPKRTSASRSTSSTKSAKTTKAQPLQSFKISPDAKFLSVGITKQTIYWSALLIFILVLQLWILNIQLDIIDLTDSIVVQTN
jgi:hypothetical protein